MDNLRMMIFGVLMMIFCASVKGAAVNQTDLESEIKEYLGKNNLTCSLPVVHTFCGAINYRQNLTKPTDCYRCALNLACRANDTSKSEEVIRECWNTQQSIEKESKVISDELAKSQNKTNNVQPVELSWISFLIDFLSNINITFFQADLETEVKDYLKKYNITCSLPAIKKFCGAINYRQNSLNFADCSRSVLNLACRVGDISKSQDFEKIVRESWNTQQSIQRESKVLSDELAKSLNKKNKTSSAEIPWLTRFLEDRMTDLKVALDVLKLFIKTNEEQ